MIMRVRVLAALVLVAALGGPAAVGAQGPDDPNAGINGLVRGFLVENAPGYLPPSISNGGAHTETPRSAFGGESLHDPEIADTIVIEDSFTVVVNPSGTRGFGDFGPGLSGPTLRLGSDSTPGASAADPFVVDLDAAFGAPLATGSAVPPTGPEATLTLDAFIANLGGEEGVDYRVIATMGSDGVPIDGPLIVQGIRVRGNLPMTADCGGDLFEIGSAFELAGGSPWPANPSFPEDLFIGGSDAIVARCRPGVGWYIDALRNGGSSFLPLDAAQSSSVGIVSALGVVLVTPARYLPGAMGARQFAFTTPDLGGSQPDNTAHTANVFPGFVSSANWPTLVGDPFPMYPRVGVFPLSLDFSGDNDTSICGANQWSDPFELHVEEGVGPSFPAKLYQFPSGQFTSGTLTIDGSTLTLDTSGGGTDYTESFGISGGTGEYTYTPSGSPCPMTVTVSQGWQQVAGFEWQSFSDSPDSLSDEPLVIDSGQDGDPGSEVEDEIITGSDGDDDEVVIGPDDAGSLGQPGTTATGDASNLGNYGLIVGGVALVGGGYLYERRRKSFTMIQSGLDEPASAQMSEQDLAQYQEFGVSESTDIGRQAMVLAEEKAAMLAAAAAHESELEEQRIAAAAARKAEFESQLLAPPMRSGNRYLTDNPYLAFAFGFIEDFENGNARDRLYTFVETVPEAGEALVDNTVKSVETAWNGWGEIIDDPSKLEGLDEGIVATGEQLADLGERYIDAAGADDGGQEFARMTSHLTVNLEAMALSHKVMVGARTALVNRLGGVPAATEAAGASAQATTTAGRAGATAGRAGRTVPRTPPRATTPRPPAGPRTPPPVDPNAPTVLNGYGPAVRGAPVRGGGTPMQAHPMGCGAAVMRGMLADFGLRILPEMQILREGFMLGVWEGTGMSLNGAAQVLRRVLPAGYRILTGSFRGVNNAAQRISGWLGVNPAGQVMVGLRWGGRFTGGAGHFVRVEAIRNGWVILGDPQWGAGVSVAIPIARFNQLAEVVITVVP